MIKVIKLIKNQIHKIVISHFLKKKKNSIKQKNIFTLLFKIIHMLLIYNAYPNKNTPYKIHSQNNNKNRHSYDISPIT